MLDPSDAAELSVRSLLTRISELIPREVAGDIVGFDEWVAFYGAFLGQCLDRLELDVRPEKSEPPPAPTVAVPEIDSFPENCAEVWAIHRFSDAEMKWVDLLLERVPALMRRHPDFRHFEGEEIVASWVSCQGIQIPSRRPSVGERPQGGYVMHMGNQTRQRAHLHGIMREDGSFVDDTGGRYLLGLFGAQRSTIRHAGGVHRIPRGTLARIHFPQNELGPTAHQFWNEDHEPGVGNVLFSFHNRDFLRDDEVAGFSKSDMMNRRTFVLSQHAIHSTTGHGFVMP